MVSDGPFGTAADIGVGFSDTALLAVSVLGFVMLTVTMYSIIVLRLQSRNEFEQNEQNKDMEYDAKLEHADIATLNRSQRRARAKAIMKRQRRMVVAGDETALADIPDNNNEEETRQLSRKERDKAAKETEKQERKLFEGPRRERQREVQQIAQQEKKERQHLEAIQIEQQRKLRRKANEMEEQDEYKAWKTFLSSGKDSMSVGDLVLYLQTNKSILIEDLSEQFRIPHSTIVAKIHLLVRTCRLTGVMVDDNRRFLYLTQQQLVMFANTVRQKGETTLEDLVELSKHIL